MWAIETRNKERGSNDFIKLLGNERACETMSVDSLSPLTNNKAHGTPRGEQKDVIP